MISIPLLKIKTVLIANSELIFQNIPKDRAVKNYVGVCRW